MAKTQTDMNLLFEMVKRAIDREIAEHIEEEAEAAKERILAQIRSRIPHFTAEIAKHYSIYQHETKIVIEVKS